MQPNKTKQQPHQLQSSSAEISHSSSNPIEHEESKEASPMVPALESNRQQHEQQQQLMMNIDPDDGGHSISRFGPEAASQSRAKAPIDIGQDSLVARMRDIVEGGQQNLQEQQQQQQQQQSHVSSGDSLNNQTENNSKASVDSAQQQKRSRHSRGHQCARHGHRHHHHHHHHHQNQQHRQSIGTANIDGPASGSGQPASNKQAQVSSKQGHHHHSHHHHHHHHHQSHAHGPGEGGSQFNQGAMSESRRASSQQASKQDVSSSIGDPQAIRGQELKSSTSSVSSNTKPKCTPIDPEEDNQSTKEEHCEHHGHHHHHHHHHGHHHHVADGAHSHPHHHHHHHHHHAHAHGGRHQHHRSHKKRLVLDTGDDQATVSEQPQQANQSDSRDTNIDRSADSMIVGAATSTTKGDLEQQQAAAASNPQELGSGAEIGSATQDQAKDVAREPLKDVTGGHSNCCPYHQSRAKVEHHATAPHHHHHHNNHHHHNHNHNHHHQAHSHLGQQEQLSSKSVGTDQQDFSNAHDAGGQQQHQHHHHHHHHQRHHHNHNHGHGHHHHHHHHHGHNHAKQRHRTKHKSSSNTNIIDDTNGRQQQQQQPALDEPMDGKVYESETRKLTEVVDSTSGDRRETAGQEAEMKAADLDAESDSKMLLDQEQPGEIIRLPAEQQQLAGCKLNEEEEEDVVRMDMTPNESSQLVDDPKETDSGPKGNKIIGTNEILTDAQQQRSNGPAIGSKSNDFNMEGDHHVAGQLKQETNNMPNKPPNKEEPSSERQIKDSDLAAQEGRVASSRGDRNSNQELAPSNQQRNESGATEENNKNDSNKLTRQISAPRDSLHKKDLGKAEKQDQQQQQQQQQQHQQQKRSMESSPEQVQQINQRSIQPKQIVESATILPDRRCKLCWCCCCPCSSFSSRSNSVSKGDTKAVVEPSSPNANKCPTLPDVSLEEIRMWSDSFDRLMKCPDGRKVFQDFLRCEYSEENILFWIACEELKSEKEAKNIATKARDIYEDYISILSAKEVSLDSRVRDVINNNIKKPTSNIFDEAQLQIYTLMHRDSYPRFINSPMYKKLAKLQTSSRKSSS